MSSRNSMKHKKITLLAALPLLALPVVAFSAYERSVQDEETEEMAVQATEQHEMLAKMAGTWTVTMNMPAYGVNDAKGTSTVRMLGDLWLIEDLELTMMGMPFQGHGQTGYDSEKGKYVASWIDSMTDKLTTFDGSYDEESATLSFDVPGRDPMTGAEIMQIYETHIVSDDEHRFRMLMPGPDGELAEVMTVRYERKSGRKQ